MQATHALKMIPVFVLCGAAAVAQTTGAMEENPAAKSAPAMGAMQMTGNNDKDFAMMMKAHHQKALEMAKKELADGKSEEMKAMAQKVMKSQTSEIAELDKWLSTQK